MLKYLPDKLNKVDPRKRREMSDIFDDDKADEVLIGTTIGSALLGYFPPLATGLLQFQTTLLFQEMHKLKKQIKNLNERAMKTADNLNESLQADKGSWTYTTEKLQRFEHMLQDFQCSTQSMYWQIIAELEYQKTTSEYQLEMSLAYNSVMLNKFTPFLMHFSKIKNWIYLNNDIFGAPCMKQMQN